MLFHYRFKAIYSIQFLNTFIYILIVWSDSKENRGRILAKYLLFFNFSLNFMKLEAIWINHLLMQATFRNKIS